MRLPERTYAEKVCAFASQRGMKVRLSGYADGHQWEWADAFGLVFCAGSVNVTARPTALCFACENLLQAIGVNEETFFQ